MRGPTALLVALLAAAVLHTGALAAAPEVRDQFSFAVFLDDQPVGRHRFDIEDRSDGRVVRSTAEFDVRLLFVSVYRYRHSNTEQWRDGCLVGIASETDANGERFAVNGAQADPAFEVTTVVETRSYAEDCVMSFAYWDPDFLDQDRLLNAQTGELVEVDIRALGERRLEVAGEAVVTDAYRILDQTGDIDITLWYRRHDGRWLALESQLANGRVMRYWPSTAGRLALGNAAALDTGL